MRSLWTVAFWVVLLGITALAGCKSAEKKEGDTELKKLEGTWQLTSRSDGEKGEEDADGPTGNPILKFTCNWKLGIHEGVTYVIEGDVLTYKFDGKPERWQRITVDASKDPKQIELLEVTEKGERKGWREPKIEEYRQVGIYDLDGDTLKLTLSINEKNRPAETASKRKGHYTVVLKKTKDGAEEKKKEEK
jgi:uncharacterized protein (TIGR03067 family)